MARVSRFLWLLPVASMGLATLGAQETPPKLPAFKTAIDLTTVTATVTDHEGRIVSGLPREAFDVYEDGQLQTITQFTNARVPVSLAILLDVSDSMFGRRIQDAREAVEHFVGGLLEQGDEFAIVAFNHQQHVLTPWTSDPETAPAVLKSIRPFGSTAIYDAIVAALPLIETRHRQRAALLVISDGADTASDLSLKDLRSALVRNDAFLYAIAIDASDRWPINAPVNAQALTDITDQSGGRTQAVRGSEDISAALAGIADELNNQYLIGYTSSKPPDGQLHTIRVRVRGSDDRVRARRGYIVDPRN